MGRSEIEIFNMSASSIEMERLPDSFRKRFITHLKLAADPLREVILRGDSFSDTSRECRRASRRRAYNSSVGVYRGPGVKTPAPWL